jgi:hypothetical protein
MSNTPTPEKLVYTPAEIAAIEGYSVRTSIRIFENESGVRVLLRPETMYKGRYRSLRIPRAVYLRVFGPGRGIVKATKKAQPGKRKLC